MPGECGRHHFSPLPPGLTDDVRRGRSIAIRPPVGPIHTPPHRVLLTGGTGFLGAYLLHEFLTRTDAKIYCLVRASSHAEAFDRIVAALRRYKLWDPGHASRILPLAGDVSEPGFGLLAREYRALCRSDVIVHNAAKVNHVEPYSRLRAANVEGTRHVLELAAGGSIPLHFVSTLSVATASTRPATGLILESTRPGPTEIHGNGYVLSKWAGEELVARAGERGLPVAIHRPDRVCGGTTTGAVSTDDAFWTLIRAAVTLGAVALESAEFSLTPADYVASAIVHLATHGATGHTYHLTNHSTAPLTLVWERLRANGFRLATAPLADLAARLTTGAATDHTLARAAAIPVQGSTADIRFDDTNTTHALTDTPIRCAPITPALIDRHIEYLTEIGFLPSPVAAAGMSA
ncbi:thioester reductase domain-containing protein [Nocardia macrotermitis]|uniref:Linear gramicidin synthase subunit D n=1 Tax=Nocardia macrotermitis TaxID=2585198 RepID=A0A7K0DCS3_9NOCA|nr:thioester reductase domain-containing protein [Nocardia macrotermitis]MQY23573.1 Linear gramicidin synthase subunit D [Nocardia macrotermitis]